MSEVTVSAGEQFYKLCTTCWNFYPARLGDIHDKCPEHTSQFANTVDEIKRTRSLSPILYDVYWRDGAGYYHRACRGCGKHFLKKDGKPYSNGSTFARWCGKACKKMTPFHIWGEVAFQFINSKFVNRREVPVPHPEWYSHPELQIQCQGCGKWFPGEKIDIHHVRPVSLLNETELDLIWDYSNLRALCTKCHGGSHEPIHEARRQAKIEAVKREWKVLL